MNEPINTIEELEEHVHNVYRSLGAADATITVVDPTHVRAVLFGTESVYDLTWASGTQVVAQAFRHLGDLDT